MAERTTMLRRHLRQQISHCLSPYKSLRPNKTPLLITLGILSSLPINPIMAEENSHYEWSCKPAANGSGWECLERAAPGPSYQRPQQRGRRHQAGATPKGKKAIAAAGPVSHKLDWVDSEQLTPEQQEQIANGCCGAYIEPIRTDADAELNPAQAPLRATADRSELQQGTTAILEGDVRLTQGYRSVEADRATLDQSANSADLEGNIRIREPGLLMVANTAQLDTESGQALLVDAQYVLHDSHLRGTASQLEHRSDDVLVLDGGSFTQCEPGSNLWELRGSEIKIDPNTQQGTGKHVRLNIKGVPVFYTPYLRFPAGSQRQSGFLFPSIGTSDDGGADISVPYYVNLAPNYDLTLTPRVISDRGEMLETEIRHLSESFETTLNMAYLGDDEGGDDSDKEDQLLKQVAEGDLLQSEFDSLIHPFKGEDRWLFNADQTGGFGERWYTRIDYTKVSDIDYFRDLDTTSLDVNSTTHLRKKGEAGYRSTNWLYKVKLEEFQTISTTTNTPYKQLPRINIDGDYRFGDWVFDLNNEYVRFDHNDDFHDKDDVVVDDPRILGERARLDYSLSWDKRWVWGFFKPSAKVKSLAYQLDNEDQLLSTANDSPSITVPQGTLDMGLYFERDGSLFGDGYTQTFEPRLFYFYSDFESHEELFDLTSKGRDINFDTGELTFTYNQLFRDTRFSGGDRIDDANQLSVGLSTRFIENDTGIERLRLSLGQISYFDDRSVTLNGSRKIENHSEVAARISGQIGDHWRLSSDILYNEEEEEISRASASLRYMDDNYRIFNLGYRYTRQSGFTDIDDIDNDGNTTEIIDNDTEQADISLIWPIYGNWSLIARGNHDFTNDRELETFAGLEYNDCCYRMRLLARRWLDNELVNTVNDLDLEYDQGIFLEFQFKGLAGIGSKVSSILEDGIIGYEQREQNTK